VILFPPWSVYVSERHRAIDESECSVKISLDRIRGRAVGRVGEASARRSLRAVAVVSLAVGLGLMATPLLVLPAGAASATVITVTHNAKWGKMLELSNGDAVYRLTSDPAKKSVCTGSCAAAWPPVLLAPGQTKPKGVGVAGLSTIKRAGGKLQVTFEGIPLYRYSGDHAAGQVNGNFKDKWGQWWVVNPTSPHSAPTPTAGGGTGTGSTTTSVAY
jgi:predicted lipoprotein with Yx(FWY)xxD motif